MISFPVIAGIHDKHYIGSSMSNHINPQDYQIPAPNVAYFKDVHTFVSTVGFSRSGSSLLGYLLTAHRNIVIAHEPYMGDIPEVDMQVLFDRILEVDRHRYKVAKEFIKNKKKYSLLNKSESKSNSNAKSKYVMVSNQWQARCESLQVIGVKRSSKMNCLRNVDILESFKKNLSKKSVNCLKLIFTVRNPYDMISTSIRSEARKSKHRNTQFNIKRKLRVDVKRLPKRYERIGGIFKIVRAKDIFINRHEDMVASPVDQLAKLCDFLGVPAFPDYLNDCASVVHEKPNKSRYELDWLEQQKEEVAKLIDQYDFLSGYSWDL